MVLLTLEQTLDNILKILELCLLGLKIFAALFILNKLPIILKVGKTIFQYIQIGLKTIFSNPKLLIIIVTIIILITAINSV